MKNIIMYTGPMCNFCDAAKRLFLRNNIKYEEIDITSKDGLRDEMIKKSNGRRTIPQIFFDDYHVGGYVELRALEKENKLKDLVIYFVFQVLLIQHNHQHDDHQKIFGVLFFFHLIFLSFHLLILL